MIETAAHWPGVELMTEGRDTSFCLSAIAGRHGNLFGIVPRNVFGQGEAPRRIWTVSAGEAIGLYAGDVLGSAAMDFDLDPRYRPIQSQLAVFPIEKDKAVALAAGAITVWPTAAVSVEKSLGMKVGDYSWESLCEVNPDGVDAIGEVSQIFSFVRLAVPAGPSPRVFSHLIQVTLNGEVPLPKKAGFTLYAQGGDVLGPVIVSRGQTRIVAPLEPFLQYHGLSLWEPPVEMASRHVLAEVPGLPGLGNVGELMARSVVAQEEARRALTELRGMGLHAQDHAPVGVDGAYL